MAGLAHIEPGGEIVTTTTDVTTAAVTSRDGTTIGYRQVGQGPGLVLLHGTMESSQSHLQLAEALAGTFTVYLPDRRGRGLSGPFGDGYAVRKEVEDLDALLTKTGAQAVLGVSSGAVILLQAALALPAIRKAVIFEPPLALDPSWSTDFEARYEREIAEGRTAEAMATAMVGAQMGPGFLRALPRWLLDRLTASMMASEDRNAKSGDVTMRMLAPTHHYDALLIFELTGALESFGAIEADVLLLGGSQSPHYLKYALGELQKVLPRARRVVLPGCGHGATGNANRGGKPKLAAEALRTFLAG
jgi:pimeloyl-ACP methyl ester carboxylesterase